MVLTDMNIFSENCYRHTRRSQSDENRFLSLLHHALYLIKTIFWKNKLFNVLLLKYTFAFSSRVCTLQVGSKQNCQVSLAVKYTYSEVYIYM